MNSREILKRLFVLHKCSACRKILSREEYDRALCSRCELHYRVSLTEGCGQCYKAAVECTCQPKMLERAGSRALVKLFFYHTDREYEPQNKLIYFLKHHKSHRALDFVAAELWSGVKRELADIGISKDGLLLVNIPRGRKGYNEDGFDQAAELCKAMSSYSGVTYLPLIRRKLGGKEQKRLNAAERRKNLRHSMYADKHLTQRAKDKFIILVDDVVTTGASMSAAIAILRKMAIKGVICVSLATDIKKKGKM